MTDVRNDNRLFDSQTNAASGYQVGDKCNNTCSDRDTNKYRAYQEGAGEGAMYYYATSLLNIEPVMTTF